jgi:hypothetical protein
MSCGAPREEKKEKNKIKNNTLFSTLARSGKARATAASAIYSCIIFFFHSLERNEVNCVDAQLQRIGLVDVPAHARLEFRVDDLGFRVLGLGSWV